MSITTPVERPMAFPAITPKLGHVFECWQLDGRAPQPGDVALCGRVMQKRAPANWPVGDGHACIVCLDLWEGRDR